jgi:hypothetical protein
MAKSGTGGDFRSPQAQNDPNTFHVNDVVQFADDFINNGKYVVPGAYGQEPVWEGTRGKKYTIEQAGSPTDPRRAESFLVYDGDIPIGWVNADALRRDPPPPPPFHGPLLPSLASQNNFERQGGADKLSTTDDLMNAGGSATTVIDPMAGGIGFSHTIPKDPKPPVQLGEMRTGLANGIFSGVIPGGDSLPAGSYFAPSNM